MIPIVCKIHKYELLKSGDVKKNIGKNTFLFMSSYYIYKTENEK